MLRLSFSLMCLMLLPVPDARASELGVLSSVTVLPVNDGVSTVSSVTPHLMTTNLTEGFSDDLRIRFDFQFDPDGTQRNIASVLPIQLSGLRVKCENHSQRLFDSAESPGSCDLDKDYVDTITEPVTLRFRFLGAEGTLDSVEDAVWNINPYVAPVVPLNIETISTREPVRYNDSIRLVFRLNQTATEEVFATVGLFPSDCFKSVGDSPDLSRNTPEDPIYLFDVISFAKDQNRQVRIAQTQECRSTSFIVRTWMGRGRGVTNSADPETTAEQDVQFLVPD